MTQATRSTMCTSGVSDHLPIPSRQSVSAPSRVFDVSTMKAPEVFAVWVSRICTHSQSAICRCIIKTHLIAF